MQPDASEGPPKKEIADGVWTTSVVPADGRYPQPVNRTSIMTSGSSVVLDGVAVRAAGSGLSPSEGGAMASIASMREQTAPRTRFNIRDLLTRVAANLRVRLMSASRLRDDRA